MEQLVLLYKEWSGESPAHTEVLPGAGSNRRYIRLTGADGKTVVGVVGTSFEENNTFIYMSRHFKKKGLPVPEVLAVSQDGKRYLQTDLGNRSLFDALAEGCSKAGQYTSAECELLRRTIACLPDIQIKGAEGFDFTRCYPMEAMDETSVMFDLNYFKYCFLKATVVDFNELKLEEDFRHMAAELTIEGGDSFLYRDFQARNIMLDESGTPFFIDYQGGRKGPVYYDVASFLWQASARYSTDLRNELIGVYVESLRRYRPVDEVGFRRMLDKFVLFRLLQVLGTYGFRGYFERKPHFLNSIGPAIDNLRVLLAAEVCTYPYLRSVLQSLTELPRFAPSLPSGKQEVAEVTVKRPLTVRVFSFSYKKGIPEDCSGNGGGYVFDCRSTHNPGRYEPYKNLTGLDEPVISFLENDGEILTFLQSVYKLADAHVERYMQRGFTDLMFSFGCTGGQHRSVYSAQHLAEYLHNKYGIAVRVEHREQGIVKEWKAQ